MSEDQTTPRKRVWMGSEPKCDVCQAVPADRFVDGKTIHGPWAMLCLKCHKRMGVGVGQGRGQLYELQGNEWVKIGG